MTGHAKECDFWAILCLQVMSIMQVVVLGAYRLPYGWISASKSCVSIVAIDFLSR